MICRELGGDLVYGKSRLGHGVFTICMPCDEPRETQPPETAIQAQSNQLFYGSMIDQEADQRVDKILAITSSVIDKLSLKTALMSLDLLQSVTFVSSVKAALEQLKKSSLQKSHDSSRSMHATSVYALVIIDSDDRLLGHYKKVIDQVTNFMQKAQIDYRPKFVSLSSVKRQHLSQYSTKGPD